MVVTVIGSVTVGDIVIHAISVIMGEEEEVVVQAYLASPDNGNIYLVGCDVHTEAAGMETIEAIRVGDTSHWGVDFLERARDMRGE